MIELKNLKYSQLVLMCMMTSFYPFLLINGAVLSRFGTSGFVVLAAAFALACALYSFMVNREMKIQSNATNIIVRIIISLYLVVVAVRFLQIFIEFYTTIINPEAANWFIALVILVCCAYGAYKGLGGLSASTVLLAIFGIIVIIALLTATIPKISIENISGELFPDDAPLYVLQCVLSFSAAVPLILVFNKHSVVPKGKAACAVPLIFAAVAALLLLLVYFCLGEYAYSVDYSILTLTRLPTKNLLGSVSGLWLIAVTLFCLTAVAACILGLSVLWKAQDSKQFSGSMACVIFAVLLAVIFFKLSFENFVLGWINAVLGGVSILAAFLISKPKNIRGK